MSKTVAGTIFANEDTTTKTFETECSKGSSRNVPSCKVIISYAELVSTKLLITFRMHSIQHSISSNIPCVSVLINIDLWIMKRIKEGDWLKSSALMENDSTSEEINRLMYLQFLHCLIACIFDYKNDPICFSNWYEHTAHQFFYRRIIFWRDYIPWAVPLLVARTAKRLSKLMMIDLPLLARAV